MAHQRFRRFNTSPYYPGQSVNGLAPPEMLVEIDIDAVIRAA
ncbi:MAG: hypothetical protein ACREF3_02945 [Acetobacteraceae bacterium]